MIYSWWIAHKELGPLPGMMCEDGTFISEENNIPVMSLTVLKTQSNVGILEGYISNPSADKELKHKHGPELWDFCFDYAKNNNIKYLIAYAGKLKLVDKYEQFGMTKSMNNLTILYKEL